MMRIALLLALFAATAHADHATTFAKAQRAKSAQDVVGYSLATSDYTHVLAGRFVHDKYTMAGLVLQRCDAGGCIDQSVGFGSADEIAVLGVVDLEGAPGPLPSRKQYGSRTGYEKLASAQLKFPVLVVQTIHREQREETARTGKHTGTLSRTKLHLISLLATDRGAAVLHDTTVESWPSGTTTRHSYSLERAGKTGPLDLVVVEQRSDRSRCRKPQPVRIHYKLEARRFKQTELATRASGC